MKLLRLSFLTFSASLLLTVFYPYGNSSLRALAAILCAVNILIGVYTLNRYSVLLRLHWPVAVVGVVVTFSPTVAGTMRIDFDDLIPVELDGVVVSLYRSSNHHNPGVEIQDVRGGKVRLEPIPEATWQTLKVGDHLTKRSLSTNFERGSDRLPVVGSSVLHSVRGASL